MNSNQTWNCGNLAFALLVAMYTLAPAVHAEPGKNKPPDQKQKRIQLPKRRPLVVAHRGASGYRPEHTLEAYRLAIRLGADFIEPDLVSTRDGVLIARHENLLDGTTDIVAQVEAGQLADRKATKSIDGVEVTGYFSEDYTLAEIRKLTARERIPNVRPANARFDGKFAIPTLVEVVRLVKEIEKSQGRKIGIYPETKHPTYFAVEGTFAGGGKIGINLGRKLIEALVSERFTDPARVYIQSFEVANLLELQNEIMPSNKVDLPLVQLLGDVSSNSVGPTQAFQRPYDFFYNATLGSAALKKVYGGLATFIPISTTTGYAALTEKQAIRWMADHYAEGLGPWKNSVLRRKGTPPRLTGEVAGFLGFALDAGLEVHPYTLRAEDQFLTLSKDGAPQDVMQEAVQLLELGVTGYFSDQPDLGCIARDQFLAQKAKRRSNK